MVTGYSAVSVTHSDLSDLNPLTPESNPSINHLTPELDPSAQRCLARFFTGDFAS
jgi:hypothetical protein